MAASGGSKAIVAALVANAGIAVAKFVGFLITGSSSMLAESVHSVADSGNQGLLLWGSKAGKREADDERPFGYGRERYFWAFVVALVLFALGSLFSIYEGLEKLADPHEITNLPVALGILGFGILLEGGSFWTAIKESRPLKGRLSWWQFIRRSRNPELPVVLLEDFGALIGLVVAFVGILLASTVDPVFDAYATLIIGGLLGIIAVILAIEMKSLLIGETAAPDAAEKIHNVLVANPVVEKVIRMRTMHVGPDDLLVGAKLEITGTMAFDDVADLVTRLEEEITEVVPQATYIYLEPGRVHAPV